MGRDKNLSIDTSSINGSESITNDESVFEPDSVNDNIVIKPTILTPPNNINPSGDSRRRLERFKIASAKLQSGDRVKTFPGASVSNSKVALESGRRIDDYPHHKSAYINPSRYHNNEDLAYVDHIPRHFHLDSPSRRQHHSSKYVYDSSLTPGDYLGSPRFENSRYLHDVSYRDMNHSNRNDDCWQNGLPITVLATPVDPEANQVDKTDEVIQKTVCLQKILIVLIVTLVAIAAVVGIYVYKSGILSSKNDNIPMVTSSPTSPPSYLPSELLSSSPSSVSYSSLVPSGSPTYRPSIHHSHNPSQTPTFLLPTNHPSSLVISNQPSNIPTMGPTKGCEPWCVNHPTPWTDPDPTVSQKCKWPITCGGCAECFIIISSSPTPQPSTPNIVGGGCELWCESHDEIWSEKCTWPENCSSCPQCNDPILNPGNDQN